VDSNVLIDVSVEDSQWLDWSSRQLQEAIDRGCAAINPIIYAEVSINYDNQTQLDRFLDPTDYKRLALRWEAALLAGKAFVEYRKRGGRKLAPLPDFYIGAHALMAGLTLLTRDVQRYRSYFPDVTLIHPA